MASEIGDTNGLNIGPGGGADLLNRRGKGKTWGLYGILGVLCVAIVGLVIANLVIKFNFSDSEDAAQVYDEGVDEQQALAAYVDTVVWGAETSETVEDGIKVYEAALMENQNDREKFFALKIAYSTYLNQNERTDAGLSELDSIDQSSLSAKELIELYTAYRNYYIFVDDEVKTEEYNDKISQLIQENNFEENVEL